MKRMSMFIVMIAFLLTLISAVSAAAPGQNTPTGAAPTGKAIYSTRHLYPQAQPMPVVVETEPVAAAPRRAPEPPDVPMRSEMRPVPRAMMVPDYPVIQSPTMQGEVHVIDDRPLSNDEMSKRMEESLERPLSGFNTVEPVKKIETPKEIAKTTAPAVTPQEPVLSFKPVEAPRPNPSQEIDDFNARLAKIQLEKKNLAETLRLIGNIKNPAFKVKTLVDLAEYVSRDNNYKKEADQLYKLAVAGIDALSNNKPVVVKMDEAVEMPVAPTTPVAPVAPKKPLTLIDEEPSESLPKKETKPAVEPKPAEKPALKLEEEEDIKPLPTTPKPSVAPPAARKPILLNDDADEKASEDKPAASKPAPSVEPKPADKPAPKKPIISLSDDMDEAKEKPAPAKAPLLAPTKDDVDLTPPPAAEKPTPSSSRRSLIKKADDAEDKAEPILSLPKKSDTDSSDDVKPKRRPMPKKITLDDE